VIADSAREICFKMGAHETNYGKTLTKPIIWLGLLFWLVELIGWAHLLERMPLTIAFPIMAFNQTIIVVAAKCLLHETITKRHAVGALIITAGVACVGATGL
jgi:undecaprenyl phosphate-alpha-L-ara4N flippase subunit ArnE